MKKIYFSLVSACVLILSVLSVSAQVQTPRSITVDANCHGFYEYLPKGYGSGKKFPLLIFTHGIGELGNGTTQLPLVLRNGPPKHINNGTFPQTFTVNGETFSFIVISPQFVDWPTNQDMEVLINYAIAHYDVDITRIYLTGLSMGGAVTYEYPGLNSTNANRIAAIVPIAAASYPGYERFGILGKSNIGLWALQNQGDPKLPPSYTIDYVNGYNATKPTPLVPAKMTIFNASGHEGWTTAYNPTYREDGKSVYEWMLQFKRGGAVAAPANKVPVASAGTDKTITLPTASVSLTGSGTDSDGSVAGYSWSKISGPAQFTISSTTVTSPTVSNLAAGTYVFRLTVKDDKGATGYDDVTVTVKDAVLTAGFPVPGVIQAESYKTMSGIQVAAATEAGAGKMVGWINTGDWMDYTVTVGTAGTYNVNFCISSLSAGGKIQLKKADGTVLTTVALPQTGSWKTWKTVSATVALEAGTQVLTVYASVAGWNFDWLQFTSTGGTTTPVATKTIQVNIYPGTNAYNNTAWNNWKISTGEVNGANSGVLKYSDATTSAISAYLSLSQNISDNGSTYSGGMAPAEVLRYASFSTIARTLKISGLSTAKKYDIELYSSRLNSDNSTIFSIGGSSQTISAKSNLTSKASFTQLTPDSKGEISVSINRTNVYNYINGFTITESGSTGSRVVNSTATESAVAQKQVEAVKEIAGTAILGIYPNPASDIVTAQVRNANYGAVKIKITDGGGRVIKVINGTKTAQVAQLKIPVKELHPGIYFVTIQVGDWTETRQLLKL